MRLHVPFEKQELMFLCGPRSLRMVLDYNGKRVSIKKLRALTGVTSEEGTTRRAMASTLRRFGFIVRVKQHATLEDVERAIEQRLPVIVNYRDFISNEGHYGVVTGIDKKFVYLNDPLMRPNLPVKRSDFLKRWHGSKKSVSNRWMLVARGK